MSCQPIQSYLMEQRVDYIARYEPSVKAFVDETFDSDRVLDAIVQSDERLPLKGLLLEARAHCFPFLLVNTLVLPETKPTTIKFFSV